MQVFLFTLSTGEATSRYNPLSRSFKTALSLEIVCLTYWRAFSTREYFVYRGRIRTTFSCGLTSQQLQIREHPLSEAWKTAFRLTRKAIQTSAVMPRLL